MPSLSNRITLGRFGLIIALVLTIAVLTVLRPHFLSSANLLNVVRQISINGILAVGVTFGWHAADRPDHGDDARIAERKDRRNVHAHGVTHEPELRIGNAAFEDPAIGATEADGGCSRAVDRGDDALVHQSREDRHDDREDIAVRHA